MDVGSARKASDHGTVEEAASVNADEMRRAHVEPDELSEGSVNGSEHSIMDARIAITEAPVPMPVGVRFNPGI